VSSDIRQMVVDYKYAKIPETPKYRKKKAKKTPKKADHKHKYQNIIIEYTYPRNYPVSRLAGKPAYALESYCAICGKLGSPVSDKKAEKMFPNIKTGLFGFIATIRGHESESEEYRSYCLDNYPHYVMPDYYESAYRGQTFLDLDKIISHTKQESK
jgi:hypothetical protein